MHGMQQGQRRFALVKIVTGIFTQGAAVGAVIEQVVDQLEGGAKIAAVILQRFFFCLAGARKDRRRLCRRFEQACGFAVDHPHVAFFGNVRIVHVH
ncbi:hypothetical protein D3C86_1672900 [compost metagenome]